jgi:hypothetical protein
MSTIESPMHRRILLALICFTLALSACGGAPSDPGPGGITNEDAQALDEAAAKLDAEQANPPTGLEDTEE